jgi:hypothetical protein
LFEDEVDVGALLGGDLIEGDLPAFGVVEAPLLGDLPVFLEIAFVADHHGDHVLFGVVLWVRK